MENVYSYKQNPIVRRIFLAMLAPTILMNLTTAIGSMADTVIIGHYLDDLSLSVVTFATPIYMVINTFAALFAVGGCIAMSIDSGKGDKQNANRAFSMSVELLAITGIILLLAGVFADDIVVQWLGAGEAVFETTKLYARIILIGAPIFTLNIGLAFFVRNDGRPTLSMIGMFASIVVDIILNFVFVGYMGLGVAGAAYSTVIGQLVGVLLIGTHFFSRKNTLHFYFSCDSTILRIIRNGTSSALHFVYQFLTILIMNHLLSRLTGTNGVVIYTVVFNLSTVSLSVFEGISQTIQPMVSNYYGEKSLKNIRATLRLAIIAILVICGSVTAILESFPQAIPYIFGLDDANLIIASVTAVRIFATSMIIMTVNVVIGYYLQSIEYNFMASVIISLRCFVLFLGATLILGKCFGMNGVWAAYTVAEVLTFLIILLMVRFKQSRLAKEGIRINLLLLDCDMEDGIICCTCDCGKVDLTDYFSEVKQLLVGQENLDANICKDTLAYLEVLKECKTMMGKYIEIEINKVERKVIIRDNLDHTDMMKRLQEAVCHGSVADYGPVLGWNRMCIG